jgi:small subunit ribosomal protein S11
MLNMNEEIQTNLSQENEQVKLTKVIQKKKKGKKIKNVPIGRAYIQATYNNTIVTLTDLNGNVLAWSSAGKMGFKGPKKSTPYAATVVVKDVVERVAPYNFRDVHVFVKGVGAGRESAIRALNANGLNILSIKDITPIPHNGPRPPKPRRV